MAESGRKIESIVWVGLGLIVLTLILAATFASFKARQQTAKALPVLGSVSEFMLTNQFGAPVTLAHLRGRVWVADIVFTRCAGPCPTMTRNMGELQNLLADRGTNVLLVTLTTDPKFDTPEVMARYGKRFGADPTRWWFLTGSKEQIVNLAVGSLRLTAVEKEPADRQTVDDLFIHSTFFVLIDKKAQLRGIFETSGGGVDARPVNAQIVAAIRQLERER